MSYIHQAVRRGLEHPGAMEFVKRAVKGGNGQQPEIQVPGWGIAIFVLTFIVFGVFSSAIEYTLKDVIATLAMVETPSAAITVSHSDEEEASAKEGLLETGPTITLVHQKPVTSSIRGTIKHLVSQAGRWSRFRGAMTFFIYNIAFMVLSNIFEAVTPRFMPLRYVLVTGVSGALLANLHASWTHKVIAMPSSKSFAQRIPARSNWKQLAFPAAVKASAAYVCVYLMQGVGILLGFTVQNRQAVKHYQGADWAFFALRIVAFIVIMFAMALFIVLPATVTLVRVEASILPEDEDTIVPFDRTFGGKVVPKILGGTGAVGFLDAWRSFNWEARRRVIKLYAKIFLIMVALVIAFVHIIMFETWAIMGPAVGRYLSEVKNQSL